MRAYSLRSTLNPPWTGGPTPMTNKYKKQTRQGRQKRLGRRAAAAVGRALLPPAQHAASGTPLLGQAGSTAHKSRHRRHTPCLTPLRCGPGLAAAGSALGPHQHMLHLQAGIVELARQPVHQLRQRPPCNPACAHQLLVGAGASAGCEAPSVGSIAPSCRPAQRFCRWLTMQLNALKLPTPAS